MSTSCIIIGGGITGLTTAYELVKKNIKVTIIENHPNGKGSSSWAGAGIISTLYPWKYDDFANELSQTSQALYPEFARELKEVSGIDPEYERCGLRMHDEFTSPEAIKWLTQWKLTYTLSDNKALFDVAHIRNNRLLESLKKYLAIHGVQYITHTVKALTIEHGVVIGADEYRADFIVLCTGSWTNALIDTPSPIYPVKGEMITVQDTHNIVKHIELKNGQYLVPRKDGTLLVGSTMEQVAFDTTLSHKAELKSFLVDLYPEFTNAPITHHWCGFRPGSKRIHIAQHHIYDNVYLNTGHFRNGINTSPAGAKILASLI